MKKTVAFLVGAVLLLSIAVASFQIAEASARVSNRLPSDWTVEADTVRFRQFCFIVKGSAIDPDGNSKRWIHVYSLQFNDFALAIGEQADRWEANRREGT